MLLIATLLNGGCASMPKPPSPETREQLGRIYIMALPSSPRGEFHTFARGWVAGTAKGGTIASLEGLLYGLSEGARSSGGGGPYAAAATAIATLIFTMVGAAVGGVAGAVQAVPSKTAQQIEQQINNVLKEMDLSSGLADAIYAVSMSRPEFRQYGITKGVSGKPAAKESYEALAGRGFDTVAEIRVTEAGFQGGEGKRPYIRFYMNADIQLVDTKTSEKRYGRDFHYVSQELPYDEWFADGSRELARGFGQAQAALAERVIDELFLVTSFPFATGLWAFPGQPEYGACWFYPLYPKQKYTSLWYSIRHNAPGIHLLYTDVDSAQPLLQWEPFPRPRDLTPENESLLRRISDVSYDLKIWEAPRDFPERLVYDRIGITASSHRLEYPLKPHSRYFWTIRARYSISGRPQVTRWAFSLIPGNAEGMPPGGSCDLDEIPATNYFRFQTP